MKKVSINAKHIKDFSLIASIAVLTLLCLYLTLTFRDELKMYHFILNDMENQLCQLQDSIYELDFIQGQDEKVLESKFVAFGMVDPANGTIPVILTVQPKQSFMIEAAVLYCNGDEISMNKKDNVFVAEFNAPIFKTFVATNITFVSQEKEYTESLYWTIIPIEQVIPRFSSVYEGYVEYQEDRESVHYSGTLTFYIYDIPEQGSKIKTVNLIKSLNGVEGNKQRLRVPILNVFSQRFSIDSKIEGVVPLGSTLELVVELVDENGLCYRYVAQRLTEDGINGFHSTEETQLYGVEGELLYECGQSKLCN